MSPTSASRQGASQGIGSIEGVSSQALRETGADERTIADALGQKTIEMARHYAKGADLKPKMRGVVAQFDAEMNRRGTKSVKPHAEKRQTQSNGDGSR